MNTLEIPYLKYVTASCLAVTQMQNTIHPFTFNKAIHHYNHFTLFKECLAHDKIILETQPLYMHINEKKNYLVLDGK